MLHLPRSSGHGQASVGLSPELVQGEIRDAQAWLATHGQTGGGVKHLDFAEFRD
mgnify:CR=1 FL=1